MHKFARFAATVTVAALPCIALAAHRTPGQWEVTSSMHFTKGGIQIPSEVRAQMQARGIKMPDITAPHTFNQCLTPEQAAKDEHPDFSKDKSCKTVNSSWSGDHFHAEFACSGGQGPRQGTFDGTLTDGGKAYSGTFRMEGDNPELGGAYVMDGQTSGRWLGPTCGKNAS